MNSQGKKIKHRHLDLEKDLPLTKEDIAFMGRKSPAVDPDLAHYFQFLEDIGALDAPPPKKSFYDAEFEL